MFVSEVAIWSFVARTGPPGLVYAYRGGGLGVRDPRTLGEHHYHAERRSRRPTTHDGVMADRDDFRTWLDTHLHDAEIAIHDGDPAPRRAIWSRNEPVSVLGAVTNAHGQQELDALFQTLGTRFSHCTSYEIELLSYDVVGDMAYTESFEHTSASVEGKPRTYTLRATQVYRRENGQWRVAHRHADTVVG